MRLSFIFILFTFFWIGDLTAQENQTTLDSKKHGVVWSGGLFKSWLNDEYVGFNQIGNEITAIYSEQHKLGFALNSHYMYRMNQWLGIGIHLGLGLDFNSYIEAPIILFGGSLSIGNNHQFMFNFGWADGKKRKIPGIVRNQIDKGNYTEIPTIYDNTELNTGLYLGIAYKVF